MKNILFIALLLTIVLPLAIKAADTANPASHQGLEQGFTQPPDSARPRTWWHWVSGNVSSEGITADLQAMKGIGLGGCQIFTVDQSSVKGPVKFMSPEWRGFVKQALDEADQLGLEVSIEGCDGWSETGGPWIQPEQGMQHVVWTEKNVNGGAKVSLDLPQPPATRGFYKDLALLAFPMLEEDQLLRPSELKFSVDGVDGSKLIDGNLDTGTKFKIPSYSLFDYSEKPVEIDLIYDQPVTARSLTISGETNLENVTGELEASPDGVTFAKIGPVSLVGISAFPAVTGTHFRLKFPKVKPNPHWLSEIALSGGTRVDQLSARIGMQQMNAGTPFTNISVATGDVVDPAKIIDLTGKTEWNAPPGRWTLIRIGHTGTGATTHPSTTPGLECDKLSSAAVRYHFEQMFGPIMSDSPAQVGRALRYITLDSWECGFANWTPLMPQEFSKRRGYEIKSWLPVFTGRMVKDAEASQRFLWDLRRTIADLLTENHYGVAQDFAHEHKMGLYAEAPGNGMPTLADNLACKGRTDIPMGEFWVEGWALDDSKEAASAAHIYGKPVAASESFTSSAKAASWANDPYGLKRLGDQMFCIGVNRFVFHRYAHQPWNDRLPGMSMGPWGINFERTNTWWKQGSAWIDYLSRCQYLLQQGRFVADVLYFYGEGAPVGFNHGKLKPAVPSGFDYDVCNAEILLNQTSVEHGEIVLKSGMRYRVLVLPDTDRMSVPLLQKICSLVREGAIVYGPRPVKSPSLSGQDESVQKLAQEAWGDCDGKKVISHSYGRGRVLWGGALAAALSPAPDFSASKPEMNYIHRRDGEAEIYFVSNQQKVARTVDCNFRISGKTPELWHPDTGKSETLALYRQADGCTTIPILFDPFGSVFVIFRAVAPADNAVAITIDAKSQVAAPTGAAVIEVQKAMFGVPGEAGKSRDVTAKLKELVAAGKPIVVADFNKDGDPAYGCVKTLTVDYKAAGRARTMAAAEGEQVSLPEQAAQAANAPTPRRLANGSIEMDVSDAGTYELTLASGRKLAAKVAELPARLPVEGGWKLTFPPKLGAPPTAKFDSLISWTESNDDGIKYFSGTATYRKTVEIPAGYFGEGRKLTLDLGSVKNLAAVSLNGKPLGTLWKEPFRVNITGAAKAGANELEIRVVNLWPNRLIGDRKLPKNQRTTWASVYPYKADSPLLPSGLLGPVSIIPAQTVSLAK